VTTPTSEMEASKTVDFYFDFSSTNSYFAAFLLPEICARHNALVNWLPLHLASLFRGTGFEVMAMTPRKARYLWRDHQRYSEFTGLPFKRPAHFPIKTSAALRSVLTVARLAAGKSHADSTSEGKAASKPLSASAVASFAQEVFRAYWVFDEDISDLNVIGAVARKLDMDAHALVKLSEAATARSELRAITDDAIGRGVFGAPTFFVGDEMFWGKDRLDFVERWLARGIPSSS